MFGRKAKIAKWPKRFQNLRSSRATELAAEHPVHVAAEWMGHSTVVADKHYWRVTDADFERANKKAQQNTSEGTGTEGHSQVPATEKSGDRNNPGPLILDLVLPDGLEPSTY